MIFAIYRGVSDAFITGKLYLGSGSVESSSVLSVDQV